MKETKIMKAFEQYIKKFDMNKGNIKAMYFHCLKMMELCKNIATNIGIFNEEEIIVCGLIGLFHNIGMLSHKLKNCVVSESDTEKIKETIDILFAQDGLMRKITDETKYDEVIKIAIYCQNKPGLPQGFNQKTLHYCMVIKDANIIEKFRMVTNYPYLDTYIENYPNTLIYEEFKKFKVIPSNSNDNDADKILEVMSSIFEVHYVYSYTLIKEESSVSKLIESLKINNKGISNFFYQIASALNMYVDKKISG